jgi:hypothetical protein
MNEIEEQRVIEALQAITGGLTVTERDIIDAGTRLQHNLKAAPPRRNRALLAVAAAVVLIVGIVSVQALTGDEKSAPSPAGERSPAETLEAALQADPYALADAEFTAGTRLTAQALAGLWLVRPNDASQFSDSAPLYVDGDGDWRIGVPTAPLWHGTSTLAGDTWTRRLDERSHCAKNNSLVGAVQPSTAAIASDGSLRVQLTGDDMSCTRLDYREVWDRVAPGSPVTDYLRSVSNKIEWEATSDEAWEGVYVAPGTGHMLVVDRDGSYRYYDNLTAARLVGADEGDIDVDPAQGTVAGTCGGGTFTGRVEVGQTPGVVRYVQPLSAMRITTAENGCGSDVAEQGLWVKLFAGFTGTPYRE